MTKKNKLYQFLMLGLLALGLFSCSNPTAAPTARLITETVTPAQLATPYAQQPAAGICASPQGDLVVITLDADISSPRCSRVKAEQKLEVVNNTQKDLDVQLGSYALLLAPGDRKIIDQPFGEYLLPGVHQLTVKPCCGAEIWLGSQ